MMVSQTFIFGWKFSERRMIKVVIIKIAVDGVCHTIPAFLVSSVTNVSDIEEHEKQ